ncbi:MAG TPA: inositol monophosphatase [Elusimicrobia bacterium]|nr:inositol monophosphatase [Elusimicrobiota bacterium]HBT60243.1 inositol monophosphatase [Elusimicrobiota bacterium]
MNQSLKTALSDALDQADRILRRRFGSVSITYKGRADLLTQADMESQRAILGLIRRRFPSHDYQAEENARKDTGAEYLWIVDPLDGTTNFAHGYPVCCASIALLRRGRPVLSGIHDPFRGERFWAEAGRGARLNRRRLRVSSVRQIEKALLVTGFPYDRAEKSRFYTEFYRSFMMLCHDVRRSGSAALDMAWVAAGRADGFWEFNLCPWDVAAGLLLVREAGGKVTDFRGRPWREIQDFGRQTLASNGRVHPGMMKVLRSCLGK